MGEETQCCILKDYISIVGTSQDFGLLYSLVQHPRQLARAALNNLSGAEQIFSGGMMASGNPNSGYRVIEDGAAQMDRNTDYANKMMFAAQGVRGLRVNSGGADFKTLIYFNTGYTTQQRAAIETAGARYASPGRTFGISATSRLIQLINEPHFPGRSCDRRIARIDIYTHGLPDDLAFGYEGPLAAQQSFTATHTAQLDPERFDLVGREATIYSWGCRTAITSGGSTGGLAQSLADTTGATVYAFARRTNFSQTWNTGSRSAEDAGLNEIVSDGSRVLWHPAGAMRGVVEGNTPSENPPGRFTFRPGGDE
ncbi:MAG: hypothetical protein ABJL99_15205 [Aliishimia sp.]